MNSPINPSENLSDGTPPEGRPLTTVIYDLAQQFCDQPPIHLTPMDLKMILHATVKSLEEGVERGALDTEEKIQDSFQRCVLTASASRKKTPN